MPITQEGKMLKTIIIAVGSSLVTLAVIKAIRKRKVGAVPPKPNQTHRLLSK